MHGWLQLRTRIPPFRRRRPGGAWRSLYFADIRGQQTLADAQSANDAAHDIHLATAIWYTDNAIAWNDYVNTVVPLEANYYSAVQTAWVDFATARNDAHATKEIAVADAKAAAFRRWASEAAGGYFGIYAGYLADIEEASAARTQTYERATAGYLNAMAAADALWVETVLPAWVAYEDEVSDHAVTWVDTSSRAWETAQNDIATAELAYTTAAVPVGTQLTVDLNENFSGWVNNVALADEEYWNTLADNDVTWVADTNAAEEGFAVDLIVSATTFTQFATRLDSSLTGAVGEGMTNWAGSVAGQLTGVTYTPPVSAVTWPGSATNSPSSSDATVVLFHEAAGTTTGTPTDSQLLAEGLRRYEELMAELAFIEYLLANLSGSSVTPEQAAAVEATLMARREQILLEMQQNPAIIRHNEWCEQQQVEEKKRTLAEATRKLEQELRLHAQYAYLAEEYYQTGNRYALVKYYRYTRQSELAESTEQWIEEERLQALQNVGSAMQDFSFVFLMANVGTVRSNTRVAPSSGLAGNPFKGKTPQQIEDLLTSRGFRKVGPDPMNGKGSYFHPESGRKYYLDPGGVYKSGTELPHVDVHGMLDGKNIEGVKLKYPLGGTLYE